MPNFTISGFEFNIYDLIILAMICDIILKSINMKITIPKNAKWLLLYFGYCFMTLICLEIDGNNFALQPFLKLIRLLYGPIILVYVSCFSLYSFVASRRFVYTICTCFFITSVVGLMIFFSQSTLFGEPEKAIIFGNYIFRLGGIFGEANSYAVFISMGICFIITTKSFFPKKINLFIVISLILLLANLLFTYSRTGFFSLLFSLIYILIFYPTKRRYKLAIVVLLSICFLVCVLTIPTLKTFIIDHVLFDGLSLNTYSSGRLNVWNDSINQWINSDFFNIIFGFGYKYENTNFSLSLSDNGFIYSLVATGVLGFCIYILFLFSIFLTVLAQKKITRIILLSDYIILIIANMTLDIITSSRCIVFIFILLAIFSSSKLKKNYSRIGDFNRGIG